MNISTIRPSLYRSLRSAWIVLKLIIPIYIFADVLFYYGWLEKISFLFTPLTAALELPKEAALSIISGMFLNLYAAIAFAAPLGLSPKEWTILAVFLGICHALLVETAIMHRLKISRTYAVLLRFFVGLLAGWLVTFFPENWFGEGVFYNAPTFPSYETFAVMLLSSLQEAVVLALEVVVLVVLIIVFLDFIKSLETVNRYAKRVNTAFSLVTGTILGITYGAGVLISEYENAAMSTKEVWFVGTFLMICHAIIEDTLLFVIFGASAWVIVVLRLIFALLFSLAIVAYLTYRPAQSRRPI
ncbi:nucleoside recognition protein [Sulfurospirillum sp. T05]|uniref:Nucleoside recognition protein n=1 Tax=Sulfurospirillum tamanense TaxID=2813362 RepID=A0ABS2WT60_9BACT|nr:nucleoside recognition domain-containing protein [Sulfurospirillum tamanensis]MBN2964822.1 nucleoside recognition protein [Sulfurospirillum tamanensis]